jgi:hypothetical protein
MYPNKSNIGKSSSTVHFTNEGIFYFEGKPFKIFSSKSKHPKAPQLAVLDLESNERISGLFKQGSYTYQGDIKTDTGKKYFLIEQKAKDTLVIKGFKEVLISKGMISPEDEKGSLEGGYSPLESVLEGVEFPVENPEVNQLNITGINTSDNQNEGMNQC